MDVPHNHNEDTEPVPHEEAPVRHELSKISAHKLALPVSIIIAGLLVSGTLLYINGGNGTSNAQAIEFDDLERWAKEVDIDKNRFNECMESGRYVEEIQNDLNDGMAAGVEGTPGFLINGELIVGAQPFETFRAVIEEKLRTNISYDAGEIVDNDPVLGDPNAPVTIVEFSDYQCPFCRSFWSDTLPQLTEEYIDTGKARFVYRDFPLSIHPGAVPMAHAASCAGEQGKYWEYHDEIFRQQAKYGNNTIPFVQ